MAARRAAARAAASAAEAPPPPPPEPTPEPEPELKEVEKTPEKPSLLEEADAEQTQKDEGGEKIRERIIERIIICPGGQDSYCQPPAPVPQCHCPPPSQKGKRGKGKKGKGGDDGLCKHPFCIVQRARVKPQGLPWASGLYRPSPAPATAPGTSHQPPIVVCQRPVLCCCPHCRPPPSDSESDAEPEPEPGLADTQQFMSFMNMVFAASNIINERPDAF